MGAKPTSRYPLAAEINSMPRLRAFMCEEGPDGCIGCESPCAYGPKYWRLREESRRKEIRTLRTELHTLLEKIEELELVIRT